MPDLIRTLDERLDVRTLSELSRRLEADGERTREAASMLLPIMIGGLARETVSTPQGRIALDRALERDHDGRVLDALDGLLDNDSDGGELTRALDDLLGTGAPSGSETTRRATDGDGILEHVLGDRRDGIELGVTQATGLDTDTVGRLASALAPILMGALGRVKRERNLAPDAIADLLDEERRTIEREAPDTEGGTLERLLDSNRDGKIDLKDDVAKAGMALGAAFLISRRQRPISEPRNRR